MLTIRDIMQVLPHRYPMLLVDRILELEPGKRIVGLKNVTANEHFFLGHFPGFPVMPGVLIIEGMAQCAAVLILQGVENRENKLFYFGGIDKARFRKPVVPGDRLIFDMTIKQVRSSTARFSGVARVDDVVVAEAEFLSVTTERPA